MIPQAKHIRLIFTREFVIALTDCQVSIRLNNHRQKCKKERAQNKGNGNNEYRLIFSEICRPPHTTYLVFHLYVDRKIAMIFTILWIISTKNLAIKNEDAYAPRPDRAPIDEMKGIMY